MKYCHFIWDYDGTLIDTYPVMTNVLQKTLASKGIVENSASIEEHLRVSMGYAVDYYRQLYQLDGSFVTQYYRFLENEEEKQSAPFIEVRDVVREIYNRQGYNYLFTHRGESGIHFLHKFGLFEYFTDFITSCNGFARKPSPDGILHLIEKHEIPKDKVIMVGDRDIDVMAAINAGIAACFIGREGERNANADYCVSDLRQFIAEIEEN